MVRDFPLSTVRARDADNRTKAHHPSHPQAVTKSPNVIVGAAIEVQSDRYVMRSRVETIGTSSGSTMVLKWLVSKCALKAASFSNVS